MLTELIKALLSSQKIVYPSADNNKGPILEVLQKHLATNVDGQVLEIASGTGQHISYFAAHFPQLSFQPSEYDTSLFDSIKAYANETQHLGHLTMISSITPSVLTFPEEVEELCYKNISNIDNAIITSLEERLDRISVLKLEFCNLTETHIEVLANILVNNYSLSEVSVNGNPNEAQNFYHLLHNTNILSLSLKFCAIDSKGIEKISNELYYPFESSLLHLNLSSNSIRNDGIEHIVRFLRLNRTLVSLNLADNKIYDLGCMYLMLTLQKFPLNFEEIVIRRKVKFDILRKNVAFTRDNLSKNDMISKESLNSQIILNQNVTNSAKMNLLNHPFLWDPSEEKENKDIYCQGNDILTNLNLSYNRITPAGLHCIIEMLHYQINNYVCDKGISRISTEGNDFNHCENILNKLKELVGLKAKKSVIDNKKKSHLNLRKRS